MFRLILLALIVFTACGESISEFGSDRIAGTYRLRTIGNDTLPITVDSTVTRRVQLAAAEMLLGLNGVYREIWTIRTTQNGSVTAQADTFTGTWAYGQTNTTLVFTAVDEKGPFSLNGTWDLSGAITLMVDGTRWVYRK
jgi:hypothetical protein